MAAAVFSVVLAVSWQLFSAARRHGDQVSRYSRQFQALAVLSTRLESDLAAAVVPRNADSRNPGVAVRDGGRAFVLVRTGRSPDLAGPGPRIGTRYAVQWKAVDRGDGLLVLSRTSPEGTASWAGSPLTFAGFRVESRDYEIFAVIELMLAGEETAGGGRTRGLPLRVVRRLQPPSRMPDDAIFPFPEELLGPLPPDTPGPAE